jgi:hypothetical protein
MSATTSTSKVLIGWVVLGICFAMAGCGGVNNSSTTTTSGSQAVAVSLNQASVTLGVGTTTQFSATVQNTTNTSVTWSVDTVAGGNSTVGTISSSGLYTAPSQVGNHTVTATSVADTTKSANAAVTVGSVSVTPASISVPPAGTQQFGATVQGFPTTSVTWSVDKVSGGNATVGTITAAGLYTAPSQPGNHTITASLDGASATAAVAVTNTISVSPSGAYVAAGAAQQFTANVSGVTWAVDAIVGGNAMSGTITAAGLYTAPSALGAHTITASLGTTSSEKAPVTIFALSISPSTTSVAVSGTDSFTATIQGLNNPVLTWSVNNVVGGSPATGTITSSGQYTAPSQVGTSPYIVSASVVGASGAASVAINVINFTVTPTPATVDPTLTQQFTATLAGSSTFAWSVDGTPGGSAANGTISATGLYTAPSTIGTHKITATTTASPIVSANAALTVINDSPGAVLTYHNDDARDGVFSQETSLTPTNVNQATFGKLYAYPVDGQIYGQPLYMPQLSIPGNGTHNVVFVTTQNNSVYAFDASATSAQTSQTLWHRNFGTPVNANDSGGPAPNVGILSTPVIDVTTNTIYLVVENPGSNGPAFSLRALNVTTGLDQANSPAPITATYSGTGADSSGGILTLAGSGGCYQRMGLALNPVSNAIYMAFGSCDHGWVLAYDKTKLTQMVAFNDTPDGEGGGLWAGGGAPAIDDATGDLYLMSGVDEIKYGQPGYPGIGDPVNTGYNDSFMRLDPSLNLLDYFTPADNYYLAEWDADLGSGADILVPSPTNVPMTIGGGKDGNVFVVNRSNMGGYNPNGTSGPGGTNSVIQTVQVCNDGFNNIFSTPVYWNGAIYYHCNNNVIQAFSWNSTSATAPLSTSPIASGNVTYTSFHGATPSLSSNALTNGIIWDIDNSNYQTSGTGTQPCVLHAYDATNLDELYNSSQAGSRDTAGYALKFTVPTIAGGRVFVPTSNELDIYGVLP